MPLSNQIKLIELSKGWKWAKRRDCNFMECTLLENAGFKHGFFTRLCQEQNPSKLVKHLNPRNSVHFVKQVHGKNIVFASKTTEKSIEEGDALVSDRRAQSLWVCTADCIPLLIADSRNRNVATCHAGWRGIAKRIIPSVIKQMERIGSSSKDLLIAIGPSISISHYEVELNVIRAINTSDNNYHFKKGMTINPDINNLYAKGVISDTEDRTKKHLSISLAAIRQIKSLGLSDNQISNSNICTYSNPSLFNSWRRDHVRSVQWSGICSN